MAGPAPHYIPPPPPPPPPGFGEGGFGSKPTSGKAIASLVCGLVGLPLVLCYVGGLAGLVGVVLGFIAIAETGASGSRGGRGLAIAGTIVSIVSVCVLGAYIAFIAVMTRQGMQQAEQYTATTLDQDQRLIMDRMKAYYLANDNSLGPGGSVLSRPQYAGSNPSANAPAPSQSKVTGTLKVEHLVDTQELAFGSHGGTGSGWVLTVTGNASATLSARDWGNTVIREVAIRDIGKDDWSQTIP